MKSAITVQKNQDLAPDQSACMFAPVFSLTGTSSGGKRTCLLEVTRKPYWCSNNESVRGWKCLPTISLRSLPEPQHAPDSPPQSARHWVSAATPAAGTQQESFIASSSFCCVSQVSGTTSTSSISSTSLISFSAPRNLDLELTLGRHESDQRILARREGILYQDYLVQRQAHRAYVSALQRQRWLDGLRLDEYGVGNALHCGSVNWGMSESFKEFELKKLANDRRGQMKLKKSGCFGALEEFGYWAKRSCEQVIRRNHCQGNDKYLVSAKEKCARKSWEGVLKNGVVDSEDDAVKPTSQRGAHISVRFQLP